MSKLKLLPTMQSNASVRPLSLNEETRSVDVIWSTGSKGLRHGTWGDFYEELSLEPGAVDLSRMHNAPVLDSHNGSSVDNVIGTVDRVWLDNGKAFATLRFASDAKSQATFEKVRDGILKQLSFGYIIQAMEEITKKGDSIPSYRVTRMTPYEISIVSVGFDAGAVVRKQDELNEVQIIGQKQEEEVTIKSEDIVKQERQRASEIRLAVRSAKLEDSFADDLVERGVSADEARKEVFAKLAEESSSAPSIDNKVRSFEVGETDRDKKRNALTEALAHRIDSTYKPHESSQMFRGMSLVRSLESLMGRQLGETDNMFAHRTLSSSDFPLILSASAEKAAQNRYRLAPRTYTQFCGRDTLRNYKEAQRLMAGDFSSLIEKPEGAEYKQGSFGEGVEIVQLKDYGITHAFTSQMIVNDDLKMLQQLSSEAGLAASRLEDKLVYNALKTNKVMNDGVTLYHASHGNLGTAGAPSETTFAEAFKLMRTQTSLDGKDTLNIAPRYVVCGPENELAIRKLLAAIQPTQSSNVNVFSGMLELIVDSEISDKSFFFLADSSVVPTVTLFHLEGQERPRIESRVDWSTDSLQMKVAHACAAAPMDWRGIVKNPYV